MTDLERQLMDRLVEWKHKKYRKPLILWGARQVGKTWILKEFGSRYFRNTVYISLYNNRRISELFDYDYNPDRIIKTLEVILHTAIYPQETLIVFDEVQNAPRVVESLKYFCEEAPEYAVVAAGSLLGVSIHEGVSFPVGKVDELRLYPLNFREYLTARGEEYLASLIVCPKQPEAEMLCERCRELLREYMIIGGMPEVVARFCEDNDYTSARELQLSILHQYEGDFGKHIKAAEMPRIRMIWNAIPVQLAKENRKFFFGQIKSGARMKDFELSIQWLVDSGLVYKVNKVEKPAMPLKAYTDISAFKLFAVDIGLLGALGELDMDSVRFGNSIFTEFKGALTEQYVLQQLVSSTPYTPYYYSGEKSTYETDFLIQKNGSVIPLEVKSEENLRSKSLKAYFEKFNPPYAVRISMSNYREQDWMTNIPLWSVEIL